MTLLEGMWNINRHFSSFRCKIWLKLITIIFVVDKNCFSSEIIIRTKILYGGRIQYMSQACKSYIQINLVQHAGYVPDFIRAVEEYLNCSFHATLLILSVDSFFLFIVISFFLAYLGPCFKKNGLRTISALTR